MRATRAMLTGDQHPTIADPSPLDCCSWCKDWIAEEEEPGLISIPLDGASELVELVYVVNVEHRPVTAVDLRPEGTPGPPEIGFAVLCSQECCDALGEARLRDAQRAAGIDVPRPEPTVGDRLEAEALLEQHCAWCRAFMPDDAPVETLPVSFHGDPDDLVPGVIGIDVAGREIHAVVPPAGFPMPPGFQALFVVCSPACAAALSAASEQGHARLFH